MGTAVVLVACGEKSTTEATGIKPAEVLAVQSAAPAQSSAVSKPAGVVEEFFTSSMPDTFTIPHNTCAQGEGLQTLKKE
jgi:hypothetical protein